MTKLNYDVLKEITLLYVEDDKNVQDTFARQLEKKVGKLILANDGQEGYDKYLELKPDMILTDINMPKITGLEMTRKIRESDNDIAIFVTTAYNDSELISESLYLNICGYLVKPINKNELFSMLIGRSKLIISQKANIKKTKMLQSIIDADSHMLAVTDLKTISFANKTFINFFNIKNAEEFNSRYKEFIDVFLEQEGHIHKKLIEDGDSFIELMLKTDATKRNVMIFDLNKFMPKAFHFTLTPIDRENNKDIYLATFIDISLMTLEKIEMQTKVYRDNLTHIYNRNKIDEVIEDVIARYKRYDESFSMILIDIDHFKNFNDVHGHLVGDEVLITLANTIDNITRDTDTFARWGGEEFVMILPNTTKENASIVAEHLRGNVEKIKHPTAGGVTASFGVTQYEKGNSEKSMYKKCDEALYKAKENGRNRVEVY